MKCENCGELLNKPDVVINMGVGQFYLDAEMCYKNKITLHQDGKDISKKCVGVVMIDEKSFGVENE